jgi:hypothetical protein
MDSEVLWALHLPETGVGGVWGGRGVERIENDWCIGWLR